MFDAALGADTRAFDCSGQHLLQYPELWVASKQYLMFFANCLRQIYQLPALHLYVIFDELDRSRDRYYQWIEYIQSVCFLSLV